jgi:hypothetical protein
MKRTRTIITALVVLMALLASCATKSVEQPAPEPEMVESTVIEVVETHEEVELPVEEPEEPEVEIEEIPVEIVVEEPVPTGDAGAVIVKVEESEAIIPIGNEPVTEEEAHEIAQEIAQEVAQELAQEVAEIVEEALVEAEAEKLAEVEPAGVQTRVVNTDSGDILLTTKGTLTSIMFPVGTQYGDMEAVVIKLMDLFPQTAFTFGSSLNMQAPENFVRDNAEELDFVLKTWFALPEDNLPVKTEPEIIAEENIVETTEQKIETVAEIKPVDVLPAPENLNIQKEEPVEEKQTVGDVVTNVSEKAKGVVEVAASKTGLSGTTFMLIICGILVVALAVVIIIRIRKKKKS